jgi:hypothetical protein
LQCAEFLNSKNKGCSLEHEKVLFLNLDDLNHIFFEFRVSHTDIYYH